MNEALSRAAGGAPLAHVLPVRPLGLLVVGAALCFLGCAHAITPSGNSAWFDQCAARCADERREVIGIVETETQTRCFCGKQLPPDPIQGGSSFGCHPLTCRRPEILGPFPGRRRPTLRLAQYEDPPAPPDAKDPALRCQNDCHVQHCHEWVRCGAIPDEKLELRCKEQVNKNEERCRSRCGSA